jgi:glycosyltransferase involved in cell wall biosynthesis
MLKKLYDAVLPRRTKAKDHDVRSVSVIVCTRNRAQKLSRCLTHIDRAIRPSGVNLEVVVVDNNSEDNTQEVFDEFNSNSTLSAALLKAWKVGLGHARNCGIRASAGNLIIFTDDDCYIEKTYFINLMSSINPQKFQYGGGQILLYNSDDDPRVAKREFSQTNIIPPRTSAIKPGLIQGANMFFLRSVFKESGFFNENMGAGTEFPCEDIEMASRASRAGFVGAMLPSIVVHHDHGRKLGSDDACKTIQDYAFGRGAYYASLIADGTPEAWRYWQETFTKDGQIQPSDYDRLSHELLGASKYIRFLLDKRE